MSNRYLSAYPKIFVGIFSLEIFVDLSRRGQVGPAGYPQAPEHHPQVTELPPRAVAAF